MFCMCCTYVLRTVYCFLFARTRRDEKRNDSFHVCLNLASIKAVFKSKDSQDPESSLIFVVDERNSHDHIFKCSSQEMRDKWAEGLDAYLKFYSRSTTKRMKRLRGF